MMVPEAGDDRACGVGFDSFGNVYVSGTSAGPTHDDIATIKYNSAGALQWVEVFNGSENNNDQAADMKVDMNGNVYITGGSFAGSSTGFDVLTLKYNSDGTAYFTKYYSGGTLLTDFGSAVTFDISGNVYVAGKSWGQRHDYITIKYSSTGIQEWTQRFNGSNNDDVPTDIAVDNFGNVTVTGYSERSAIQDFVTIQYENSGIEKWKMIYLGDESSTATAMTVDSDGNIFVTGEHYQPPNSYDYLTIKYAKPLTLSLTVLIEGFYNSASDGMQPDSVKILMRNSLSPFSIADSATGVLDSAGKGAFYFYNAENEVPYYISVLHRNALETWNNLPGPFSSGELNYDFTTSQSQAFGKNQVLKGNKWCIFSGDVDQNGSIDGEDARAIENDARNNVSGYVATDINCDGAVDGTDLSFVDNNIFNYVTAITPVFSGQRQQSGNLNNSKESAHEGEINLEQNYPNPFNPKTVISYSLSANSLVTLKVYDITGKEVATLVNETQDAGVHTSEFDGSTLSSGMYFYKLKSGNFSEVKRMMLIK